VSVIERFVANYGRSVLAVTDHLPLPFELSFMRARLRSFSAAGADTDGRLGCIPPFHTAPAPNSASASKIPAMTKRMLMSSRRLIRESFRLAQGQTLMSRYSRVHDAVKGNDVSTFPLASNKVARPRMFSVLSAELTVIDPV